MNIMMLAPEKWGVRSVLRAGALALLLTLTACGGGGSSGTAVAAPTLAASVTSDLAGHTVSGLETAMDRLIGSSADSASASAFEAAMDAMATGNS